MNKNTLKKLFFCLCVLTLLGIGFNFWFHYQKLFSTLRPLHIEQVSASVAAPIDYGFEVVEMTPEAIQTAREYLILPSSTSSAVIRLSEDPAQENILAIHEDGLFRKWNVPLKSAITEYDFLAASKKNTFFNEDGSRLVSTGEVIWDTQNGEVLDCREMDENYCPTPASVAEYSEAMYIDPVRPVKIDHMARGASWFSFDKKFTDMVGPWNGYLNCYDYFAGVDIFGRKKPFNGIYKVAIDPSGTYIACAISNGNVIIRNWSIAFNEIPGEKGNLINSEYPYVRFVRYTRPDDKTYIKDMAFDATRTWLSALADKKLIMWDLRRPIFARKIDISIDDGNAIAFDRSGKLLAVGTNDEIIFFDTQEGRQIAQFDTAEVTALYFTRDNRLLVWGDAEGNIHLWGVPNP
jgi:WD40 repeat protein